jgi:hypothetical protein
MIKKILALAIIIPTICITGCKRSEKAPETISDMMIGTTFNPQAKFQDSATYVFSRKEPENEGLPSEVLPIVKRVRLLLQEELRTKKYNISKDKEPDYLVDYHITAEQGLKIIAARAETSDQVWLSVLGIPDEFVKGSLVVDVIDAKTLKLSWRGICNANFASVGVNEKEKDKRAKYAVQQMLKTFPP